MQNKTERLTDNDLNDIIRSQPFNSIPTKNVKDNRDIIFSNIITRSFNSRRLTLQFPAVLKNAEVKPAFKKNSTTNKTNYRAVSLLPVIFGVYE